MQRRRHTISDPAFTGFAKIVRDLTERKLREEANQLAFEREQVAREQESLSNQLKDNFIAVLSHELKHPLDLINVKAEMCPVCPKRAGSSPLRRQQKRFVVPLGTRHKSLTTCWISRLSEPGSYR